MGTAEKFCIRWNIAVCAGIWPGHLDQYDLSYKKRAEFVGTQCEQELGFAAQPYEHTQQPSTSEHGSALCPSNPSDQSHPSLGNRAPHSRAIAKISAGFILFGSILLCNNFFTVFSYDLEIHGILLSC